MDLPINDAFQIKYTLNKPDEILESSYYQHIRDIRVVWPIDDLVVEIENYHFLKGYEKTIFFYLREIKIKGSEDCYRIEKENLRTLFKTAFSNNIHIFKSLIC